MTNRDRAMAALAAIQAQNAEQVLRLIDPHLVQHCPFLPQDLEELRKYMEMSKPGELKLRVVRTLADGPFVFAQLKSESTGDDIFSVCRFQDGLVAEHWAFWSCEAPPNKSGHTQIDGPTEASHLEKTVENKVFANQYYEAFHLRGDRSQNHIFFKDDHMIRHEPGVRDGVGEFLHDVDMLMKHRTIDTLKLLVGEGDLVFILAEGTHEGQACTYVDLYRVDNQAIVEHWGFPQAL